MARLKEECGVFGIFNNKDAAALTALGLHALQHRGQEACGIVTFDEKKFYAERRLGLVGDNFTKGNVLEKSSWVGKNTHPYKQHKVIRANGVPTVLLIKKGKIGITFG